MSTDIEEFLKDPAAVWNSRDLDKTIVLYADDCVLEDMALEKVCHGKAELATFLKSIWFNYPDLGFKTQSVFNIGDMLAWEYTMTGTQTHSNNPAIPATGKSVSVRGASLFELRNGKIKRETDYYNSVTVLRQLGLMPARPPAK